MEYSLSRYSLLAIFLVVIVTIPVSGQSIEYGNSETSSYTSSQKSDDFTYLMWDRNDDGDGYFSGGSTPKFFYWDNDDTKFHFLIDSGNMSQLDAEFNSVGIGTNSPNEQLHLTENALITNEKRLYLSRNNNSNNAAAIRYNNPYYNIGWSWPDKHERAMVFESYGNVDSYGAGGGGYLFKTMDGNENQINAVAIRRDGKVGIGTLQPTNKLTVKGTAKTEEVIVEENIGADFVFEKDYDLLSLKEVEAHINKYQHLPEIPSAEEMKQYGVKVGDLQIKLLQKIEELTLHTIAQQKILKELRQNNTELRQNDKQQKVIIERLQSEIKNLKSGKSQNE